MRISEKYRAKALICEQLSRDATDLGIKSAWAEIAIEWHTIASQTARDAVQDRELEHSC